MKSIVITLIAGLVAGSAFGQGGILFATRGGGVNAPITNRLTGERLEGTAYRAQLYYGSEGAPEATLLPVLNQPGSGATVGAPAHFGYGTLAGYIISGIGGAGNRYTDPGVVAPGALTAFQIRVWDALCGGTWEEALYNANCWGLLGKSAIITVRTSTSNIDTPKPLTGLQGFSLDPIPEPTMVALGAVGLAALLWRRRK